jgi:1-carboxybiuret hydrolase
MSAPKAGIEIAKEVNGGKITARKAVEESLSLIATHDGRVNSFTDVLRERALKTADAVDARVKKGEKLPLAGVPFAVKNLFDVKGIPTRAGSKINRELPPAGRDSILIERLETAGAVLVGALNMGEYAYDFTGENAHDGPSRNPHDLTHMPGGSSGGSGAAVGAGFVPLSLGSDTNGSIRVPSSFCGLFGLKPTYGRLSRAHTFPFVASLDHLGPLARAVPDLAASYDAMQGADPNDPVCVDRGVEAVSEKIGDGVSGLRIASLGGHFSRMGEADAFAARAIVAKALGVKETIELPEATRARAAAYVITAAEGAALHVGRLRTRAADFDPDTRYRLLAGTMIPASWTIAAQKFRRWYQTQVLKVFERYDVLLAPATPCRAPKLGQKTFVLDGQTLPARPNIGIYTQPISFIGLPVVAVPVWLDQGLPIGVQVIAAPWKEEIALRVAYHLEREGICRAPAANL